MSLTWECHLNHYMFNNNNNNHCSTKMGNSALNSSLSNLWYMYCCHNQWIVVVYVRVTCTLLSRTQHVGRYSHLVRCTRPASCWLRTTETAPTTTKYLHISWFIYLADKQNSLCVNCTLSCRAIGARSSTAA